MALLPPGQYFAFFCFINFLCFTQDNFCFCFFFFFVIWLLSSFGVDCSCLLLLVFGFLLVLSFILFNWWLVPLRQYSSSKFPSFKSPTGQGPSMHHSQIWWTHFLGWRGGVNMACLGFVCLLPSCISQVLTNRVDFELFFFHKFLILLPPPPLQMPPELFVVFFKIINTRLVS